MNVVPIENRNQDGRIGGAPHFTLLGTLAEVSLVAFLADLPKHLIGGRSWQGLSGAKNPDAVLLREHPGGRNLRRRGLPAETVRFYCVAGYQVQLLRRRWGWRSVSFVYGVGPSP